MDPQQTLHDLLEAVGRRDWDAVEELSDALLIWMESGGFPPVTLGPEELGPEWHRAVSKFVCHAAASKAKDARKRSQGRG